MDVKEVVRRVGGAPTPAGISVFCSYIYIGECSSCGHNFLGGYALKNWSGKFAKHCIGYECTKCLLIMPLPSFRMDS